MRHINKIICLVIALSFSAQALPQKIIVEAEEVVTSDSCSAPAVPQDQTKSLTTGQAIGIGAGCVIVPVVIIVAIIHNSLSHMFDGIHFTSN